MQAGGVLDGIDVFSFIQPACCLLNFLLNFVSHARSINNSEKGAEKKDKDKKAKEKKKAEMNVESSLGISRASLVIQQDQNRRKIVTSGTICNNELLLMNGGSHL